MVDIKAFSDDELTMFLHQCVTRESRCIADLVETLGEFDRRRLAERRRSDLFSYCTKDLGYAEGAAFKRIRAARAARQYPSILALLREGEISLGAVNVLAPHLTSENHQTLLKRGVRRSCRELERIVADIAPKPEPREVIRSLGKRPAQSPSVETGGLFASPPAGQGPTAVPPSAAASSAEPGRTYFAFTGDAALEAKIDRCKQMLRHKYRRVRLEHVVIEAVEALLDLKDRDRRKTASRRRPSNPRSRRIPEWVKQEVWKRDGGRCAFVTTAGTRCDCREFLEFDHIRPYALGGPSDQVDNIRLRCRTHNQLEARRRFGPYRSRSLGVGSGSGT